VANQPNLFEHHNQFGIELDDSALFDKQNNIISMKLGSRLSPGSTRHWRNNAVDSISKKIAADYKARNGIDATIFSSRPSAGATIVTA
jgi:galactokinase